MFKNVCIYAQFVKKIFIFLKKKKSRNTKNCVFVINNQTLLPKKCIFFVKKVKRCNFTHLYVKNVCIYAQLVKKCYFFKEKNQEKIKIVYLG